MRSRRRESAATEAAEAFFDTVHLATSCVTRAFLRQAHVPLPMALSFGDRPAELHSELGLRLRALLSYEVVQDEGWQVRTTSYRYEFLLPTEEELFAFHWHPQGESGITFPHLHVGTPVASATLSSGSPSSFLKGFGKAHVPTGHVAFRDVLRFAVDELNIVPRRPGWREILARAEETFPPPSWW
jgi:hypothetical protein